MEGRGARLVEVVVHIFDQDGSLASRAKRQAELVYEEGKLTSWKFLEPVTVPPGHSFRITIPDSTNELERRLEASGRLTGVSMGCAVPQHRCSVCGHVGDDACEHLRAPERPSERRAGRDDRFLLSADFAPPADRCGSEKGQND